MCMKNDGPSKQVLRHRKDIMSKDPLLLSIKNDTKESTTNVHSNNETTQNVQKTM